MITVAIVALLVALAVPAYKDYTIRSKVAECVNGAAVAKVQVSEFRQSLGAIIECERELFGLEGRDEDLGKRTAVDQILELLVAGPDTGDDVARLLRNRGTDAVGQRYRRRGSGHDR